MTFQRFAKYLVSIAYLLVSLTAHAAHPRFDTIRERIENREYPSIFSPWAGFTWRRVHNRPELSGTEVIALHDLFFTNSFTGVRWHYVKDTDSLELLGVGPSDVPKARGLQRLIETLYNPNMVYLIEIRMATASGDPRFAPPADSPYWVHDSDGNRIKLPSGRYLVDFAAPDTQEMIIKQAVAVQESGLFDGIMFDWWHENRSITHYQGVQYRNNAEEQAARDNIIRGIRDATHPDFLILVNMNENYEQIERNAHLINGGFMETWRIMDRGVYNPTTVVNIERSLRLLEQNTREPRVNCLAGGTYVHPDDLQDVDILPWMRMFTTMSLVHSNGYVLYTGSQRHNWYEFWDADLGKPIEETSKSIGAVGGFQREYENGWAVCNRSINTPHTVTFSDYVLSLSTDKFDFTHEVPPMDGDIFLKTHPTNVSPHEKLATTWSKMKKE